MRILVTGSEGMLGKDSVPALAAAGNEVRGVGRAECDITDAASVEREVKRFHPNVILNCAAFPDVDGCERDPARAHAVNELGPGILAKAADAVGARLFHISTDYVFDGTKGSPYVESDPTSPVNIYGRSKLGGELAVMADGGAKRHLNIRVSWLFGFGKANFVENILKGLESSVALKAVSDQVSCPTWTLSLSQRIAEVAKTDMTGILHLAGSGRCTRQEMAAYVVEKMGSSAAVAGITWAELKLPAARPFFSATTSERLASFGLKPLPDWRAEIDDYLKLRKGNLMAKA